MIILVYGNVIWCPHPHTRKYIDFVENVQRKFSKCIEGTNNKSYEERLAFLNLPSLEFRRLRGDLIETYKICNGLYDPVTTSTLFDMSSHDKTRSNGLKINKTNTVHNNFKYFFTNRIVNVWNGLPAHVVRSDSVNSFKNHIDKLFKEYMYSLKINISHH